jgi:uncharacterized protein (UPF0248 family)
MPKNPLRELLNRIKHDPALDQSLCSVEYRDFEGRAGVAKAPLIICQVESQNIRHGDAIIPFHRITKVSYEKWVLYPFPDNDDLEMIFKAIGETESE